MAVPFIYFSLLALLMYIKRRKVDIPFLVCILYATSGFLGLFIDDPGYLVSNYKISFWAAFSYCALLTMTLYPISRFSHIGIKYILPVKNERLLKALSWAAFIWFLVYAYASRNQFVGILSGDMRALRSALYEGTSDASFIVSVPVPVRLFLSTLSYILGCNWILIFLAFYTLVVQKLPTKYFVFFLIGSLSSPWGAVLGVDRSAVATYLLSFAGVIVFFWPYMQRSVKKGVSVLGLALVACLMAYLGAMTVSRFGGVYGNDMDSVNNSLVFYLGHSFLYFCYYFDTFNNPLKMSNLLLPFTNTFIFGDTVIGGMRINEYLYDKLGIGLGYFYTFVGQIQITAGHMVAILFCIALCCIGTKILSKRKQGIVTPCYAFMYFFFSSFMLLGLFSYYYQLPAATASVVCFVFIFKILGYGKSPINTIGTK